MWNETIKKVHDGEANRNLSFFTVGIKQVDMEILTLIAPPNRNPLKLKKNKLLDIIRWFANFKKEKQAAFENTADPKKTGGGSALLG